MTVFYLTTRPLPGPPYTTPMDAAVVGRDPRSMELLAYETGLCVSEYDRVCRSRGDLEDGSAPPGHRSTDS
jgi:hypothetical protein